jgi:hypothetical protein
VSERITVARSHAHKIFRETVCRRRLLSGQFWPPGSLRISPINPFQHIAELRRGDGNRPIRRRWPDEPAAFQPLRVERHAEAIMPRNLQKITATPTKNVEIPLMRIAFQDLLNLQRQTVQARYSVPSPAGT